MAMEFATVRLTSGSKPGAALEDSMKHITSPLLLVAAGPEEKPCAARLYDRAAGDAPGRALVPARRRPHGRAIREAAPEYERRVTAFFDDALLER